MAGLLQIEQTAVFDVRFHTEALPFHVCGMSDVMPYPATRYRDLTILVGFGLSLWMYATPVVYPMRAIPEGFLKTLIRINPASEVMELIRLIMLGEGDVDLGYYALSAGVTVLLFIFSAAVFNRVERTFQDTV